MAFDAKAKMEKTLEGIKNEMNTIRTGRASAAMFDKVRVDYYGQKSPLNQVAQISIPEARTVVISPFDKSLICRPWIKSFKRWKSNPHINSCIDCRPQKRTGKAGKINGRKLQNDNPQCSPRWK